MGRKFLRMNVSDRVLIKRKEEPGRGLSSGVLPPALKAHGPSLPGSGTGPGHRGSLCGAGSRLTDRAAPSCDPDVPSSAQQGDLLVA